MRSLILLAVLLAILLGLVWVGGEALLAARARQALAGDGAFTAAGVDPLPGPARLGLRLESPRLELGAIGALRLAQLDIVAGPLNLARMTADFPTDGALDIAGQALPVALRGARMQARLAPLSNLALGDASLIVDGVDLDGAVAIEGLSLRAQLTRVAPDAPPRALAAYAVDLSLVRADGGALPPMDGAAALMPPISADGALTVWLSDAPARGVLSRGADTRPPVMIGAESRSGIEIGIGDQALRLSGRLAAAADGLAEGAIALDGADPDAVLDLLADAGLIAPMAAPIVGAALRAAAEPGVNAIAAAPVAEPEADADAAYRPADGTAAGNGSAPELAAEAEAIARSAPGPIPEAPPAQGPADAAEALLPQAAPGALRVILRFEGGRMRVGPADLGPAPMLSPPAPG